MKKATAILLALLFTLGVSATGFAVDTATPYTFADYIALHKAVNNDVQGWLYVEGTNISHPVLFYPDTFYYIDKDIYKNYSRNGVIYAEGQTRTGTLEEMSPNTVLYGHNWTNVSANPRIGTATDVMFAQLAAFHHYDFAKDYQFINYSNIQGAYVFQVFAAFYSETAFVYYRTDPTQEQFNAIVAEAKLRSLHTYDVPVAWGDHIITLSTCTRAFGPSADQRFVVMGKMVPAGTAKVAVTQNPNYKRPIL